MARTIAVGPAPPSRGSVIGETFGQGLGLEFARRQAEERALEQQMQAFNPIRSAITERSPMAQAAGVASETMPTAEQFVQEGAAIPDLQGMQRQLSAAQSPAQRIVQRLASDPEAFARAFSGADTGELIGFIQSAMSPEEREFGFENVPGVGLVRTDPRRGTAETVVRRPEEPVEPSSAVAKLRRDLQGGLITREEFETERRNLLASDEPVVEVADPESTTGRRFVRRSEAPGAEAPEPGTLVDLSGLSDREQVQALSGRRDEIQNRKQAGVRVARLSNRLREQLEQDGAQSIGVTGWLTRLGNSASEQAQAAAQRFGLEFDPEQYDFSAFPEEARRASGVRSNTLALAFAIANAREPGRLTDQDVQRALDTIGASSGSVDQLRGAMDEAVVDAIRTIDDAIAIEQSNFEGTDVQAPSRLADDLERIGLRLPEQVRSRLQSADQQGSGRGGQRQNGAAEEDVPQFRSAEDVRRAPMEQIERYPDDRLEDLPTDALDAMIERLEGNNGER